MLKNKTTKITTLDYAILGLLHQGPLSGYGILKMFKETAMGAFGSGSPGTIYPALTRMEKSGLIVKTSANDSTKNKFRFTESGTDKLKKWLILPLNRKDIIQDKDILLLRFAFMDGLTTNEHKLDFLESCKILCADYLEELQDYHKRKYEDFPLVGRLAFEHGIASYKATLTWCKSSISTLKTHFNNEK